MHLRQYRVVAVGLVAALALGAFLLLVVVDPWGEAATEPSAEPAKERVASVDDRSANAVADLIPVNPGAAGDISPAKVVQAGWQCLFVVHAVHCAPPGGLDGLTSGSAESVTVLVFDTKDPAAEDAPYLGTEYNLRADLFDGQPCVSDPPSMQYTYLGAGGLDLGLDYYACHGFDSPL